MDNNYFLCNCGMVNGPEEWANDILVENIAKSYEDILSGKMYKATNEQIEFYKKHPKYDLYHLFYMLPYNDEEKSKIINDRNLYIKKEREYNYRTISDSLYMAYIKNEALGNKEKSKHYYEEWLKSINDIKSTFPYENNFEDINQL